MIPQWVRDIPHPTYGFYGGQSKRWVDYLCPKPKPVDWMDNEFQLHDIRLWMSNSYKEHDPWKYKQLRTIADRKLGIALRHQPYATQYAYPVYGPVYNLMARLVFRP